MNGTIKKTWKLQTPKKVCRMREGSMKLFTAASNLHNNVGDNFVIDARKVHPNDPRSVLFAPVFHSSFSFL